MAPFSTLLQQTVREGERREGGGEEVMGSECVTIRHG